MKNPEIKLFLLSFLLMISLLPIVQATPGTLNDPIDATLGDNTGNLLGKGSTLFFSFTPTTNQWYNFSLVGAKNTSFFMDFWDMDIKEKMTNSNNWYYPNFIELGDLPNLLYINVIAFEGGGDFTLTITEIDPQPKLESVSYSDEIIKDKIYAWSMSLFWDFSWKEGTSGLNNGDYVIATWPVNGNDVQNDVSDPTSEVKPWIQVNDGSKITNITEDQTEDLAFLFEPTYYLFDDGSEMDLREALIDTYANWGFLNFSETEDEYIMGGTYKSTLGNKTVLINIDKTSGIVNSYYYLKYTNNAIEDHWEETRITDPSELALATKFTAIPQNTDDQSTSIETPINLLLFSIPLILIPIVRHKKKLKL